MSNTSSVVNMSKRFGKHTVKIGEHVLTNIDGWHEIKRVSPAFRTMLELHQWLSDNGYSIN